MKAFVKLCVLCLFLVASTGYAATLDSKNNIRVIQDRYLKALNHENDGVRNRTIFIVVQLKMCYPDENYEQLVKKLKMIVQKDACCVNRVHGNLATIFLENDGLSGFIDPNRYKDPVLFFNDLYRVISEGPLALR